jgi:EAL domain-containing protein (putative c-di-GMP-specific phosphodiesterase class I)
MARADDKKAGRLPAPASEGVQTVYLRSFTEEVMGWSDPRQKLTLALRDNHFLLFGQRVLPLKVGLRECCEILLRLREEEDNLLPPGGFIPAAENYEMMEDIDRWVVRNLLAWLGRKLKSSPGWQPPIFCINLSLSSLSNPEFARFARREIEGSPVPSDSLCFELGDIDAIAQPDKVRAFVNALKPAGCRFTLDAFGSVRVSFAHVKGLAIDFLKIDGALIQHMLRNRMELAKVKAINAACQRFGIRTIGQFVETDETLAKLREIGVDYAQGFGIARPGPIDQLH